MRMRVAFVVPEFPSISQTFVLTQIVELLEGGHEVHIYPAKKREFATAHGDISRYGLLDRARFPRVRPANALKRFAAACGVLRRADSRARRILLRTLDVRRFGSRALTLKQFFEVLPFLDSKPYDVIHCHFGTSGLRARRAQSIGALKGTLVTSFHGHDALTFPAKKGKAVYRDLFAHGSVFTSNTAFLAGRLAELGCPREKTVVLPASHDTGEHRFRERSLRNGDTVELLTVARLVEGKGIKYAIRAVTDVRRRFPNLRYRIVGDGPLREDLQREIRQSGAEGIVELLGWRSREEVGEIYDASHLFILPGIVDPQGWVEAQGVVLQEAQALGLPVIASRVGGIPEGVMEGESAVLVSPQDAAALAAAIENLIENSGRWAEMGRAGRRFVEERFSLPILTDQLVAAYSRATEAAA